MKQIFSILVFSFLLTSCFFHWDTGSSDESTQSSTPKTILALGDSLTAGYWVDASENYPTKLENILKENNYNYTVINAGVSWDTSAQVLARAEKYLSKKPDMLILVVWWNDGLKWLPVSDMQENILEIVDMYEEIWTKVVIWGMDIFPTYGLGYRSDFKKVYKTVVKERKDVELYSFFLSGVATKDELNLRDKVHPNADGYDVIVEKLYTFLKKKKLL